MRSTIVLAALTGAALATPMVVKRQEIEFDQFDAAPAPEIQSAPIGGGSDAPTYDSDAAAAAATNSPVSQSKREDVLKRVPGDCAAQPQGKGPVMTPDNDTAFIQSTYWNGTASGAVVPDGYSLTFGPVQGATSASNYLGYYTFDSFNPILCQQKCDQADACYAFNMYFERDPTQDAGDNCLNPPSTTNIKCSLWGTQIDSSTAHNDGQWRRDFHVVIAGSMGYNKLAGPPAQPGWTGPTELGGAINAPDNSYVGYKYFAGPYNPAQCASSISTTNAYNQRHPKADGTYTVISFFNAYVLSKNGVPSGTYCSMYSKAWSKQYGTNYGQYRGSDYYSTSQSYGYTLQQSS